MSCAGWRFLNSFPELQHSHAKMVSKGADTQHGQTIHSCFTLEYLTSEGGFCYPCYLTVTITAYSFTKCKVQLPSKYLPIIKGP